MIDGIQPREASDRLNFFMVRFDDLWRKYVTYSGGEQLFGLEVSTLKSSILYSSNKCQYKATYTGIKLKLKPH